MDWYTIDANGNMAMDSNKGISNIRYNSLNLPERIQMTQGHIAEYIYDGWGIKRSEVNTTARAGVNVPLTQTMELAGTNLLSKERLVYIDNKIYRSTDDVNYTLIKVNTPEGYLTKSGNNFVTHSYLKDHLGNIRMDIAQGKTIKDGIHYFPFGIEYYRYSSDWGDISWERFNGKEMKGLFGQNFLDYGARFYDPALGRWQVPDPLAEKYYNVSPYAYCSNNPINRIDPTGMDDYWLGDDGLMILAKKTEDKFDQLYATTRDEGDHLTRIGNPLKVNDKNLLPQLLGKGGAAETSILQMHLGFSNLQQITRMWNGV